MGKKARTVRGKARAEGRKLDHSELPPPPDAPGLEVRKHHNDFIARTHHVTTPVPSLYYYGSAAMLIL